MGGKKEKKNPEEYVSRENSSTHRLLYVSKVRYKVRTCIKGWDFTSYPESNLY